MRLFLRSWSPLQLLWQIVISNAVVTITAFSFAIYKWHAHGHSIPSSVVLFGATLILLSAIASMSAESTLQDGINSERWSDAQVSKSRKLASHPVVSVWIGSLVVFMILYAIVSSVRNPALGTLVLPAELSLIRLSSILRRKPQNGDSASYLQLSSTKPLHSDSWGR